MSVRACHSRQVQVETKRIALAIVITFMLPLSLCASTTAKAIGVASQDATYHQTQNHFFQPYCGLYSIYAAAKLAGKDVDFRSLLKSKYISSSRGSTEAELDSAARDLGLHSLAVQHLMSATLQDSPYPVILHVKSAVTDPGYDHWILYTGCSGGKARILDPSSGVSLVDFGWLSSRWDGSGLVVSPSPISSEKLFAHQRTLILMWSILILAGIIAIRLLGRTIVRLRYVEAMKLRFRVTLEALAVLTFSIALAFGFHEYAGAGLLHQASSVAAIERIHFPPWKQVSYFDLRAAINKCVIIDARYPFDYQAGHIPGAINIPPDTSPEAIRRLLTGISSNAPIIVYCQSQACPFSKIITNLISSEGYSNLGLYTEGWLGWKQNAGSSTKPAMRNRGT